MKRQTSPLGVVFMIVLPLTLRAEGIAIKHDAPSCMIAGRFPELMASFDPAHRVARARVDFRAEADRRWYYVEMKRSKGAYKGVLPRPLKDAQRVHYYIEVADKDLVESRTEEHVSDVVDGPGMCADPKKVAPAAGAATVKVGAQGSGADVAPIGFAPTGLVGAGVVVGATGATGAAAGGHATAVTLGVLGAGAVAGGVVAATKHSTSAPENFLDLRGHWSGEDACPSPTAGCGTSVYHLEFDIAAQTAGALSGPAPALSVVAWDGCCLNCCGAPNITCAGYAKLDGILNPGTPARFEIIFRAGAGGRNYDGSTDGSTMTGTSGVGGPCTFHFQRQQ